MRKTLLGLAIALGAAAPARAACAIQSTGLGLGIPGLGDSGSTWASCMRDDLQTLNDLTVSTVGFSSETYHLAGIAVGTDTLTAVGVGTATVHVQALSAHDYALYVSSNSGPAAPLLALKHDGSLFQGASGIAGWPNATLGLLHNSPQAVLKDGDTAGAGMSAEVYFVSSGDDAEAKLGMSGSTFNVGSVQNATPVTFLVQNAEIGRFDADGLGVGTTNPATLLEIHYGSFTVTGAQIYHDGTNLATSGALAVGGDISASTGTFAAADSGACAAPQITFSGDPNAGICSTAADTVSIAQGGAAALTVESGGNVGIGTTNPSNLLHIYNSGGNTSLQLERNDTGSDWHFNVGSSAVDRMDINETGSAAVMSFLSGGNVGIGTTDATTSAGDNGLVIKGSVNTGTNLLTLLDTSLGILKMGIDTNQDAFIAAGANGSTKDLHFGVVNSTQDVTGLDSTYMTIETGGNVGIGTTNPGEKLDVVDGYIQSRMTGATEYGLKLENEAGTEARVFIGDASDADCASTLCLATNAGNVIKVGAGGIVNINSEGDAAADLIVAGDTEANLLFVDASANRVGIGSATPGYALDVVGVANATLGFSDAGVAGVDRNCAPGEYLEDPTVSGGIHTAGTCSTPSGSGDVSKASTQTFTGANTFESSSTFTGSAFNLWKVVGSSQVTTVTTATVAGLSPGAFYQFVFRFRQGGSNSVVRLRFNDDGGGNNYQREIDRWDSGAGSGGQGNGAATFGQLTSETANTNTGDDVMGIGYFTTKSDDNTIVHFWGETHRLYNGATSEGATFSGYYDGASDLSEINFFANAGNITGEVHVLEMQLP